MEKYLSRVSLKDRENNLMPISDEALRDIYLEALNKINNSYIEGTIKYIQEHHKELDAEINMADDRINELWGKCNEGKASIEDFKTALIVYETLYIQAINLNKRNNP